MKLHDIFERYNDYDDYDDYEAPDTTAAIELCAGPEESDEYVEVVVRADVDFEKDERYPGGPEVTVFGGVTDIYVEEPFTFKGRQYQSGQEFPEQLMSYLCDGYSNTLKSEIVKSKIPNVPQEGLQALQSIRSPQDDMKMAVWAHKYMRPKNQQELNEIIKALKASFGATVSQFYDYVEKQVRENVRL